MWERAQKQPEGIAEGVKEEQVRLLREFRPRLKDMGADEIEEFLEKVLVKDPLSR